MADCFLLSELNLLMEKMLLNLNIAYATVLSTASMVLFYKIYNEELYSSAVNTFTVWMSAISKI